MQWPQYNVLMGVNTIETLKSYKCILNPKWTFWFKIYFRNIFFQLGTGQHYNSFSWLWKCTSDGLKSCSMQTCPSEPFSAICNLSRENYHNQKNFFKNMLARGKHAQGSSILKFVRQRPEPPTCFNVFVDFKIHFHKQISTFRPSSNFTIFSFIKKHILWQEKWKGFARTRIGFRELWLFFYHRRLAKFISYFFLSDALASLDRVQDMNYATCTVFVIDATNGIYEGNRRKNDLRGHIITDEEFVLSQRDGCLVQVTKWYCLCIKLFYR